MKTKRTLLQWFGFTIAVSLTLVIAFAPIWIYVLLCWKFVTSTLGSVMLWILLGIVALVAELIWGPSVGMWWEGTPSQYEEPPH